MSHVRVFVTSSHREGSSPRLPSTEGFFYKRVGREWKQQGIGLLPHLPKSQNASSPAAPQSALSPKVQKKKNFCVSLFILRARLYLLYYVNLVLSFFLSSIFICCKVHILFPTHHSLALVGKEIYLFFVVARFVNVEARKSFVARAADPSPFFGGRPPDSRILYSL